jgi:hypothetical protein
VLPCEDEDRVVRVPGSRGVSTVLADDPLARAYPVAVVGIYLNVG